MPVKRDVQAIKPFNPPLIRTCVIVDDERMARKALKRMLNEACPDVHVIAEADSVENAVECITRLRPEIVFLDIEIIGGTGFDVLDRIPTVNQVCVVFTTAHREYRQRIADKNLVCLYKPIVEEMLKQVLR